jgi:hypothetical protein
LLVARVGVMATPWSLCADGYKSQCPSVFIGYKSQCPSVFIILNMRIAVHPMAEG